MRILVTGAGGFVGRHLIRELVGSHHEIVAFDASYSSPVVGAAASHSGDLRDTEAVCRLFASIRPEACVHLGGVSFVPAGKSTPDIMLSVNIAGTVNVLDAVRSQSPNCRLLVVSTAQVYRATPDLPPITEDTPLRPVTLYGVSKAAADMATLAYAEQYGIDAMTARPNNHTGPGQSPQFAVPAFARQVKAVARGEAKPPLRVGNLESRRDLSDVRDVVRAYRLLIEKGRTGAAYNISSQNMVKMGAVLEELCRLAKLKPRLEVDPSLYRPADDSPLLDTAKLTRDTGWKPQIPFSQTLRDVLSEA
jgi:GDP-4-dehydro-6-deoxy-D-mannose reductase